MPHTNSRVLGTDSREDHTLGCLTQVVFFLHLSQGAGLLAKPLTGSYVIRIGSLLLGISFL